MKKPMYRFAGAEYVSSRFTVALAKTISRARINLSNVSVHFGNFGCSEWEVNFPKKRGFYYFRGKTLGVKIHFLR